MTGWEQCFYPLSASPITAASLEVRGAKALSQTDGTPATFGVKKLWGHCTQTWPGRKCQLLAKLQV